MWPGIDHLISLSVISDHPKKLSDIRDDLEKPSDVRDHLMSLGDLRDHLQLLETISSVTEQGVVTYTSPIEAFATAIKNLDRWKSSLIAPFRCSWSLDFTGVQRTKHGHASVVSKKVRWSLILVAQNSSWSLDRLQKRTLIAWFHFDPGCKRFYRRCVCDYPLLSDARSGVIEWWLEQ